MRLGRGKQANGQNSKTNSADELIKEGSTPSLSASDRPRIEDETVARRISNGDAGERDTADLEARLTQLQARLDAQRRELEETRAKLATREAQLDALQLDIDQREAAIEDQRRQTHEARQRLAETRSEVQRLNESFEAKQTSTQVDKLAEFYRQQQAELDAERQQVQGLRDQLRQERADLAELQRRVEEGRTDLDRRTATQQTERDELEKYRAELLRQEQQTSARAAQLSQDQTGIEVAVSELNRRREDLEREQLSLQSERDHLAAQREQLDEQRGSLTAEQAALTDRAESIEKQRAALTAQRESLSERQAQLEAEIARVNETRERIELESEEHRADLRRKLEQLETQLTQVTERGQQLSIRQREVEARQSALEESEHEAAHEQARRRAEMDTEQQDIDERRIQLEADERRVAEIRSECDRQEAELARKDADFAEERDRILKMQATFDVRSDELAAREQHLDRVEAELSRQRELIEAQRSSLQSRETSLTQREDALETRERELAELESGLRAEQETFRRQAGEAEAARLENERELERQLDELTRHEEDLAKKAAEVSRQQSEIAAHREEASATRGELEALRRRLDERTAELDMRSAELEALQGSLEPGLQELREQADRIEQQRKAMTSEEDKLTQTRRQVETQCQAAEAKVRKQYEELNAARQEFEQRLAKAVSTESGLTEAQRSVVDEQKRLAQEMSRLQNERRLLEQERQDVTHQVAEERQVLDQRREELARQAADLTGREQRLAEEVESLEELAAQAQQGLGGQPLIIETGGFNLRRALTASGILAGAAALIAVWAIGIRHEVQGFLHVTTEEAPAQALARYVEALRSPTVITAAASSLDLDLSADDLGAMLGPGSDIEIRAIPEEVQIRIRAITSAPKRTQAIIDALGKALKDHINNRSVTPTSSGEIKDLMAEKARREQAKKRSAAEVAELKTAAQSQPSAQPIDQLIRQRSEILANWQTLRQQCAAAEQKFAQFSSSRPSVEVDAEALRTATAADTQLQQDTEQLRLREQQLRGFLVDGLEVGRGPLGTLAEKVDAFDREVASRLGNGSAEDVQTALNQIRSELATCRKALVEAARSWEAQLNKLRGQPNAAEPINLVTEQQQAEKNLSDLLDQLGRPIVSINAQIKAIAQSGGDDMTRRIVLQDALKKQAEEMTTARRDFANAGAEIIPMSSERLEACLKQVTQLRSRISFRQKEITQGLERQAGDQVIERREKQLADLRRQANEAVAARDQAIEELLKRDDQLLTEQLGQAAWERRQAAYGEAAERDKAADRALADIDKQITDCRKRLAIASAPPSTDTADYPGAIVSSGLANQNQLVLWALAAAGGTFMTIWSVSWLVAGGRPPVPRRTRAQ